MYVAVSELFTSKSTFGLEKGDVGSTSNSRNIFANHLKKIRSRGVTKIDNSMDEILNRVVRQHFGDISKNFTPFNFHPPKMMKLKGDEN